MVNRRQIDQGKIVLGVIEGGHKDDPDPQKLGRVRVREIGVHGPNVKTKHLPFVQQMAASGTGQHETPRPQRPGQVVHMLKTGDGYGHVLGIAMGLMAGMGNMENIVPQLKTDAMTDTGMSLPPNIQDQIQSNRSGLEKIIKIIVEKSLTDIQQNYEGLPSSGASPSLAGIQSNPVQNVSTALTLLSGVLSASILSSMPGTSFSLGNLLLMLSQDQQDDLFSDMPDSVKTSFFNMMQMKQAEIGTSMPGNFSSGGQIDPIYFLPLIIKKLKTASNSGSLDDVFIEISQLLFASSGLETLADIVLDSEGLFGPTKTRVSPNGQILIETTDEFRRLEQLFTTLVSSIPSSHGDELFGSSTQIPELMKRAKTTSDISATKENLENKHPEKNETRYKVTYGGDAGTTMGSKVFFG